MIECDVSNVLMASPRVIRGGIKTLDCEVCLHLVESSDTTNLTVIPLPWGRAGNSPATGYHFCLVK